jgi:hypothetical protein
VERFSDVLTFSAGGLILKPRWRSAKKKIVLEVDIMTRNNKLINVSGNKIAFGTVEVPTVEEALELKQSEKGNRTFFQAHDVEQIWVNDGGYRVHVMVTCYIEAGTITGNEVAEAISDKDKAIAETAKKIAALKKAGFTEAEIKQILKLK